MTEGCEPMPGRTEARKGILGKARNVHKYIGTDPKVQGK